MNISQATAPNRSQNHVEKAGLGFVEFIALSTSLTAIIALSIDIMLPVLPMIGDGLGVADPNSRQLVIVVFTVAFALGHLFFGPLSDRYGRRPLIMFGNLLFVFASIAATFSTDFTMLLFFRALQGIASASLRVVAMALIRDCFSGEAMGRIMAFSFTTFMIIPIIAPAVGQVIGMAFDWRAIFALMAIIGTCLSIWTWVRLRETLDPADRREISPSNLWAAMVEICTHRVAAGYTVAATLSLVGLFGYIVSVQQVYGELYGLGVWFPAAFAGTSIGMALTSLFSARLVTRFGMRPVIHVGMVAFGLAGLLLFVLSLFGTPSFAVTFILISIAMMAFGISQSQASALAMEPLGHIAGVASSLIGVVTSTIGAVGGGLVGQAYNGTVQPLAFGFAAGGIIAMAVVYWTEKGRVCRR